MLHHLDRLYQDFVARYRSQVPKKLVLKLIIYLKHMTEAADVIPTTKLKKTTWLIFISYT